MYKYIKMRGLHSREITSLPKSKNVMNIEHHFNHSPKKTTCSSEDLFAYNESLQHAITLPPHQNFAHTDSSPFLTTEIFTCSKEINAFKR